MFLNQYLFEIGVGEQSDSYQCCGMCACTDEKKTKNTSQHITDWYSKNCGIITVLSCLLTQHRTDKGETSHDKNQASQHPYLPGHAVAFFPFLCSYIYIPLAEELNTCSL